MITVALYSYFLIFVNLLFMQIAQAWISRVDLAEDPKIHKANEI